MQMPRRTTSSGVRTLSKRRVNSLAVPMRSWLSPLATAHKAAPPQEAVDDEYKSEKEEEDKFDSDFMDSEVNARSVEKGIQEVFSLLTIARSVPQDDDDEEEGGGEVRERRVSILFVLANQVIFLPSCTALQSATCIAEVYASPCNPLHARAGGNQRCYRRGRSQRPKQSKNLQQPSRQGNRGRVQA